MQTLLMKLPRKSFIMACLDMDCSLVNFLPDLVTNFGLSDISPPIIFCLENSSQ
jgi:hypothetical protein